MDQKFDVVIIGGGVIGICTAYYLSSGGLKVAVVEKNEIGSGCSFGNAGLISPSHFVPLAAPGMVAKGLQWMFNPESPFYIHPRADRELLLWLWRYFRSCTTKQMNRNMPVLRDLTSGSLELFKKIAAETKTNFGFEHRGLLMLFNSERGEKENRHEAQLAHAVGVEARVVDNAELRTLEPNIPITARGGVFFPNDAHVIPDQFVSVMAARAKENGVTLLTGSEVLAFNKQGDRIASLSTAGGTLTADEFVLAGGSWSPRIVDALGVRLSVQAGKGYSVTITDPEYHPKIPFILTEARVAITPMGNSLRFAGTLELSGIDLSIGERRVKAILNAVPKYFSGVHFNGVKTSDAWAGLRPCSPDGLPFIGRFPSTPNLICACGHAMLGLTLGPITGKLVSEILLNQKPSLDIRSLNPERFE